MKKLLGFEGRALQGPAGSIPATLIGISRDISYGIDPVLADVSDREFPDALFDVAELGLTLEMELNNKDGDASVAAIRAAAVAGAALAFRLEDKNSGFGPLGDFVLGVSENQPYRDAQRLAVTCTPTDKAGRKVTFGRAGTLTTRTDDTSGQLTIPGHTYTTGNLISITWDGGQRLNVVVGTVAGDLIDFSGGTGTVLPAETTAVFA